MRRSSRYGGMIVDAELLWIVIATNGTKSLTVLAFIVDEFGILRIENSSFFYSLKASRLQTKAPNTVVIDISKPFRYWNFHRRKQWISYAHGCLCQGTGKE
jgi:hypothetical protein